MINHINQFKKVKETFEEVEKQYEIFIKKTTYENRNLLKIKIKKHRAIISDFIASINNIFLKKEDK